ncbi:hypothetical protein H9P43_006659 [Blastocladiella emersonii ATCC 22665]|nr:hypothetical protein H9P43_006659 [Blastocladiella emersonii ATCC 22665]
MVIDSDVLFLGLAKAFEINRQLAGANINKTKVLDSLQCKDKAPSATMTTPYSAAHQSELGSLRRPATVAIADAVFEIKSLKAIKGAGHRAAIKRARSTRSSSTDYHDTLDPLKFDRLPRHGRPRVGGIKTKLKNRFSSIKFKEWRRRWWPRASCGREGRSGAAAAARRGVS